ncbi:MAG TPA: FAD-binding oxidoreductase [Solirubrobacteraceae bacterium]|jgi:glycolate oxidase FAD binding subunit
MARELHPGTFEDAAAGLAAASAAGERVRICGAQTKLGWGAVGESPDVELHTTALNRILEHNVGDLTAILEAGVPLSEAQRTFAAEGQMLSLDPPLGRGSNADATVGGVVATADSGPLRHRYGAARDLVVGMTVALSDGTIARSGGKVIKNVAGYDIAKLFSGAFGTLGAILSVSIRLHPVAPAATSALGGSGDPEVLATAARMLTMAPLELDALDVAWQSGWGQVLTRLAGAEAARRIVRVTKLMREAGLEDVDVIDDDEDLWARQRAGQRSQDAVLARVAARPTRLADVLRAVRSSEARLVGRASLGLSWIEVEPDALAGFRQQLPPDAIVVLLDVPDRARDSLDPWGAQDGPAFELMRRIKMRFDPAGACNPGVFVGGI